MTDDDFNSWVSTLPKAELHLHIDGSLQAHRLLATAKKNNISLPYKSVEDIDAAYQFTDLQSFLDLYYLGASVMRDRDDFYHLMMDYLLCCREQNIVHTEIMVEPQTYFPYGVELSTVMEGFIAAITDAKAQWGQSVALILSLLRHLSEDEAIATLEYADAYREHFVAVGLASAEVGNPPEKFSKLYAMARERGYKAVAHAGEEGPAEFIWRSLQDLQVQRIDHGVRCSEDESLMEYLIEHQIPLTVCPLSNVRLCVFENMTQHTILQLLERGVMVTVNSDDPTYFCGFLNENFYALRQALNLSKQQTLTLLANSFSASFLDPEKKVEYLQMLQQSYSR